MPVELKVKSELSKILKELGGLTDKVRDVQKAFEGMADDVTDNVKKPVTQTERMLTNMSNLGHRVLGRLADDFKALLSVQSLAVSLKFSEQFKNTIAQTVTLSDTIRKLGGVLNIARGDFASFQKDMMRGLGDIGIESGAAARALQGLSETPVRGREALIEYAKVAGQLGVIGGERGREGEIARGMARVITARGGRPGDVEEMRRVAESIARVRQVTGKAPTEALDAMEKLYTAMPKDFRQKFSTKMLEGMSTAALVGGQNATRFLQEFLSLGPTQRAGLEARGIGRIITEKGLNIDAIRKFAEEAKKLAPEDTRLGMMAMGLTSNEAAEGALRLVEQLDKLTTAQKKLETVSGDLTKLQDETSTMGEAFGKSLSKVKGILAAPFAEAPHVITRGLVKASQTTAGATAVVAGGGLLAAMLAGFGLRGVGRFVGRGAVGGLARAGAAEAITGRQVVPVYVTNANEISGGMAGGIMPGMAGRGTAGILATLGKAAGYMTAAAGVFLGARAITKAMGGEELGKNIGDYLVGGEGGARKMGTRDIMGLGVESLRRLFAGEEQLQAPRLSRPWDPENKIIIEDKTGKLQTPGSPSRSVDFMNRRIY